MAACSPFLHAVSTIMYDVCLSKTCLVLHQCSRSLGCFLCAATILHSRSIISWSSSSVRRMKESEGSRVTSWLSSSPLSVHGGRESMSGAACNLLGMCLMRRLYSSLGASRTTLLLFCWLSGDFSRMWGWHGWSGLSLAFQSLLSGVSSVLALWESLIVPVRRCCSFFPLVWRWLSSKR